MHRHVVLAVLVIGLCGAAHGPMTAQESAGSRWPALRKQAVAHRGASAYAPEHTLAAYRLAVEQGADYVEQDLVVTSDGALICLHDDSLERTTNVEEIFRDRSTVDPVTGRRQRLAVDFTLAEIKRLDAGRWFAPRFAGERVPAWEEAIAPIGTTAGLTVTPYTFTTRTPAAVPARFADVGAEMRHYLRELNVDALFTDNPDRFPR
jgi:glycerophosphoryl diester phosphodiesterase